jgi:peptidoglycan/LPS O-acetylase OafA/YrhL
MEVADVPDAVAPPPRHPRFELIEGMRAMAALSVLGVHAALASGEFSVPGLGPVLARLNIGVTIFFLISGFLLYRPMVAWRGGQAYPPPVRQYVKRRCLRIFPAYWAILTILLIVPGLGNVDSDGAWPMYTLVHTLVGGASGCTQRLFTCGLAQTWSLVAEMTFYAVLPVLAAAMGWLTQGLTLRRWLLVQLAVLSALAAGSLLLEFVVLAHPPALLVNTVAGYALWFALGMAMAVVSVWAAAQPEPPGCLQVLGRHPGMLWVLAGILYLGLAALLPANSFLFVRNQALEAQVGYAAVATLLLLPAVFDAGTGWPRKLLANRVVAWLGLVSYGIFLWHYVLTLKLGPNGAKAQFVPLLAATLVLSIVLAAASYYGLERPLLRLKYRRLGDLRLADLRLLGWHGARRCDSARGLIHRHATAAPDGAGDGRELAGEPGG